MSLVVLWAELVSLIAPYAPAPGAKGGRPPFTVDSVLRIHFIQQWLNLVDPAMGEALYDTSMFREFVGLDAGEDKLCDESTILRLRHLPETDNLNLQILFTLNATLVAKGLLLTSGTVVDATLITAPSSAKNRSGEPCLRCRTSGGCGARCGRRCGDKCVCMRQELRVGAKSAVKRISQA